MKLKKYFIQEGITASQFATRIGRAVSTVTRLANGETVPEPETLAKIVEATGGAVQPNDFFLNDAARVVPAQSAAANATIDEEDLLRARCYRLLARLLAGAPDAEVLGVARALQGDGSPFGQTLNALAAVARQTSPDAVGAEFHSLFVGMPQGELLPYGSYYLTGFLNEKPLANLRGDLAKLGLVRRAEASEPEDHIAGLCEAMACLIEGSNCRPIAVTEQRRFFDGHIGTWASRFFQDLEAAQSAVFYMPVGRLGRLFMEVEAQAFDMAA
ncbi:MAG: helix-turn-helix domain-containing protein [Alphaproteobacteria bacterium]|nr:helix-turn-helix domain-containing protein [Alphaproteobacteria bacterium]